MKNGFTIAIHKKGYRVPLDFEEVEFTSIEPVLPVIKGEITKEELKRRRKGRTEGPTIAEVRISPTPMFPVVEIEILLFKAFVPERKWYKFEKKKFKILGIDFTSDVYDYPTLVSYVELDEAVDFLKNIREALKEIKRAIK